MNFFGITDKGKVRRQNQDVYRTEYSELYNTAVLVVCDGMGGARAGNIASSMAADIFANEVRSRMDEFNSADDIQNIAKHAVEKANYEVFKKSSEEEQCSGMGTTLVAMIASPIGIFVVNVGDSRAYHITHDGIHQVTNDHSVVAELLSSGQITKSEARTHPSRNLITRAIGTSSTVQSDIFSLELKSGDYVLLCSDGLSNIIGDQEFLFEILRQPDISKVCDSLVELALERGAPDNVTAVIYQN